MGRASPTNPLCGPGRAWAGPNRVVPRATRLAQPIWPSIAKCDGTEGQFNYLKLLSGSVMFMKIFSNETSILLL
jgi:hypothetical protein